MRKFYYSLSLLLLIAVASLNTYVLGKSIKRDTNKLSRVVGIKPADRSYLKSGMKLPLPQLKPNAASSNALLASKNVTQGEILFTRFEPFKTLSDVQIYPNPITDQINLRYNVAKSANVTIKIMDVLGNEVVTMFSQRVDAGDQKFTFNRSNKLGSGFYFVRIVAGSEAVIKRIFIL